MSLALVSSPGTPVGPFYGSSPLQAASVGRPHLPSFCSVDLIDPEKADNASTEVLSGKSPVSSPSFLWGSLGPVDSRFCSIPAALSEEPIEIHFSSVCVCVCVCVCVSELLSLYELQEKKITLLFSRF